MSEKTPTDIATTENTTWLDANGEVISEATWKQVEDGPFVATSARALADNMSEAYNQFGEDLSKEEKSSRAKEQMRKMHESLQIPIDDVFVMKPQIDYKEPLHTVFVDEVFQPGHGGEDAVVAEDRADLIVTFNEEVALECRPADCPVVSIAAQTKDNQKMWALLHVGWNGLNAGYLEQAMDIFDGLDVERESMRVQISGAGYADNFHYKNAENPHDDNSYELDKEGNNKPKRFTHPDRERLFVNAVKTGEKNAQGQDLYEFDMDMPGFIRNGFAEHELDPYQVYEEGSDTTSAESGYSSHRRDGGDKTKNTRDVVILRGKTPEQTISKDRADKMLAARALRLSREQV